MSLAGLTGYKSVKKEGSIMRRSATILIAAIVGMACVSAAVADDINPPLWRGDEGSTYQRWEFGSPANPGAQPLEIVDNPYGDPELSVWPGLGQEWLADHQGRDGVWPLSGDMVIRIPNRPEPNLEKRIWIQLTWGPQTPVSEPGIDLVDPEADVEAVLIEEIQVDSVWTHSTYAIVLPFNPPEETLHIHNSILVDELVIDTICIPEPATMSLLAIGGLGVLLRRKR
jgi:hypothetical protein